MADKTSRAELAEAVRELRAEVAQLRAERAAHQCHGCSCGTWAYYYPPAPQPSVVLPWRVTCETPPLTIGTTTLTAPVTATDVYALFGD